jgi:hypothetical protein
VCINYEYGRKKTTKQCEYQHCYQEWNHEALLEFHTLASMNENQLKWVIGIWYVTNMNEACTECQTVTPWQG